MQYAVNSLLGQVGMLAARAAHIDRSQPQAHTHSASLEAKDSAEFLLQLAS